MATYKDHLIQSAPLAAWMLDSATSTDTDISMNGRNATVYVSDKNHMPIASGASRAYTIVEGDVIYYPPLNIWSKGNGSSPFSIEFVLHPLSSPGQVLLLTPRDTNGRVQDNYIAIKNNKLSFVVSNATSAIAATERYEAYTYLDFTGDTVHCVAVYQSKSISLYVNGVLESNVSLPNGFDFTFDQNATLGLETVGAAGSAVILSAMSVYKRVVSDNIVKKHYRAMSFKNSPQDVVWPAGGTPFMINDSDREKNFYFNEPALNNWGEPLLDNLSIDERNRITLDVIEPARLNTGTATFTSSHLALSTSQYLIVDNAGKHLGGGSGAVAFYVKYTAARHGVLAAGEYAMMSLMNPEKTCSIQLVEKSDKKIYLRYKTNTATQDTLLASPSTGADSDNFVYLQFTSSAITAYWNSESTVCEIPVGQSDLLTSPSFPNDSTLILGASVDGDDNWGSQMWWLNLWSSPRNIAYFNNLKNSVYQYTLKLSSSLKVSQAGAAIWSLDTGFDGTQSGLDLVNQSRLWWCPSISESNLKIETSLTAGWIDILTGEDPGTPAPGGGGYESAYQSEYSGTEIIDSGSYVDNFADTYESSAVGVYESQANMAPVTDVTYGNFIPETIYVRAILFTDDSIDNVVFLRRIGLDIFRNSEVVGEGSADELIFKTEPAIYPSPDHIGTGQFFNGAKVTNPASGFKIFSNRTTDPITDNTVVPEVADGTAPVAEMSYAKTIEFWFRPSGTSNGLVFKYNGTEAHSCTWDSSTRTLTTPGFNKFYIDGVETGVGWGSPLITVAHPAGFENKWHLIHLVLSDVINQTDNTTFTAISGSPTVSLDTIRSYSGEKSVKIAAGGSQGYVEVYGSTTGLNTANAAYNTLSFFVYPSAGVTSISTNFRRNGTTDSISTHTVTPEKWNLVERSYSNGAALTSLSVRIGTGSANQTIWIDGVSLVKGRDAFVRFKDGPSQEAAFGYDPASMATQQASFYVQNVAVYKKSFTQQDVTNNYNAYLATGTTPLNASSVNLMPITGNSAIFPSRIYNRNIAISENVNRLADGGFESGVSEWQGFAFGFDEPTLTQSNTVAHTGTYSMKVTLPASVLNKATCAVNMGGVLAGEQYEITGYVYVPTGSPNVKPSILYKAAFGTTITTKNAWVPFSIIWTADADASNTFFGIETDGAYDLNDVFYVDDVVMYQSSDNLQKMFDQNPVHLSSAWQILATN